MKTKEEILSKNFNNTDFNYVGPMIRSVIYTSMQEYADQQTKEKDELIKFLQDQAFNNSYTIEYLGTSNKELKDEIERLKGEQSHIIKLLKDPNSNYTETCFEIENYLTKLD